MFETLKEILLSEIREEVETAKKIIDEIQALKKEDAELQEPETTDRLFKPNNTSENYNFLAKIILFKKYKEEQRAYDERLKEYKAEYEAREKAYDEYSKRKNFIQERLKELRDQKDPEKLNEIIEKYERIRNAKNLSELGLNFKQAEAIFNGKGLPIVLDESDTIIENEAKFDKLDDLVLIHKTRYAPTNDEIKTTTNAGATNEGQIKIGDELINIKYGVVRNTIHFAVNGEVGSHGYGGWDDTKYAVVIPLVDVPNITTFYTSDTFARGNVDISKGYILCPENEMEQLRKNNANAMIVGYRGANVSDYADKFISFLGYKYEPVGTSGWENNDATMAERTVQSNLNVIIEEHCNTPDQVEERNLSGINQFKAIIEGIFASNVDYEPSKVAEQLLGADGDRVLSMTNSIFFHEDGKYYAKFLDDLKQYNIVMPNYINAIYEADKVRKSIDTLDLPADVKEYLEECKKTLGLPGHLNTMERAFVYEVLKQVKELNKENIMAKQGDVKVY